MPEICPHCGRPVRAGRRRITEELRTKVKLLRESRFKQKRIASMLDIGQGTVSRILSGRG